AGPAIRAGEGLLSDHPLRLRRRRGRADRHRRRRRARLAETGCARNLVTVLQTQQTLFTAEDNHVVARLARLQAVLSLFQALGGSWMPPGVGAGSAVVR